MPLTLEIEPVVLKENHFDNVEKPLQIALFANMAKLL